MGYSLKGEILYLLNAFYHYLTLPEKFKEKFIESVKCPYYDSENLGRCAAIPENILINVKEVGKLVPLREVYMNQCKNDDEKEKRGIKDCYVFEIGIIAGRGFADKICEEIERIREERREKLEKRIMEEVVKLVKEEAEGEGK